MRIVGSNHKVYFGWVIVAACFMLAASGMGILFSCIQIFFEPVSVALGFTRAEFSLHFSIVTLLVMLTAPFMGRLLGLYNIRVVMTVCLLLAAGCLFLYSQCSTLTEFYLVSALLGISSTGIHIIPISYLITNWFKNKRAVALAISFSGSGAGGVFYTQLSSWMIIHYDWRQAYIVLACLLAATLIPVTAFIIRRAPSEIGLAQYGTTQAAESVVEVALSGMNLAEARRTCDFWLLACFLFLVGTFCIGTAMHLKLALTDLGHSATFSTTVVSIYMGMLVFGKLFVGWFSDRFGRRSGVFLVLFFFILSLLFLRHGHSVIMAVLCAVSLGISGALTTVMPPLLTADILGQKHFAVVYGVMNIPFTLGCAFGMPLSGLIYDLSGSYTLAWHLYTCMALVCAYLGDRALALGARRNFPI